MLTMLSIEEFEKMTKSFGDQFRRTVKARDQYATEIMEYSRKVRELQDEIEALKHEVPCEDCKGGIYDKYCPTCKSWRIQGIRCLDCGSDHVTCPTCHGSGLKYFPLTGTATFAVPPTRDADPTRFCIIKNTADQHVQMCSEPINELAEKVMVARIQLIEDAARKWLHESDGTRLDLRQYKDLVLVYHPDGSEELRVRDGGRVLLRLPTSLETLREIGAVP